MVWLSDGTIHIDIDVELDSENVSAIAVEYTEAIGGRLSSQKWHDYAAFRFGCEYVASSDAAQINEWWRDSVALSVYFDGTSYASYIVGDQPFQSINRPYTDLYTGAIQVEQI
jgi:predicted NAD/FAD-dependent oxidoreductase